MILNVKNWLKERSEKSKYQFEIIDSGTIPIQSVRRLYDGHVFHLSDTDMYFINTGHKIEEIICFFWDRIHVDVWIEGRDHQELIQINEISLTPSILTAKWSHHTTADVSNTFNT